MGSRWRVRGSRNGLLILCEFLVRLDDRSGKRATVLIEEHENPLLRLLHIHGRSVGSRRSLIRARRRSGSHRLAVQTTPLESQRVRRMGRLAVSCDAHCSRPNPPP